MKSTRFIIANQKMAVYLIACQICGEQFAGRTKTKFSSKTNNYKTAPRKYVNKEVVPN